MILSHFFSQRSFCLLILIFFFIKNLFLIIDTYSSKRKVHFSAQNFDSDQCTRLHLLGFCLLVRAHSELHGALKEQKVHEAVRCFFRCRALYIQLFVLYLFSPVAQSFEQCCSVKFLSRFLLRRSYLLLYLETILHSLVLVLSS